MKHRSVIFRLFALLLAMTCSFNAVAASTTVRGDVTGNNQVDISDVTALIGYLLNGDGSSLNLANADCTLNGEIDISDVTALIGYLLNGTWYEGLEDRYNLNDDGCSVYIPYAKITAESVAE